jgi:hypothetical protein
MRKLLTVTLLWMLAVAPAIQAAAPKTHVVSLGKATTVKLFLGPDETKPQDIRIRGLYVDGKLKEFTTGDAHDVTDQHFVIQRAFRVNDSLPSEEHTLPRWRWQRGGWILVDRTSGHVTQLHLPYFDAFYSDAAWYRDYAAYCGVSDTGEKLYAVVSQLSSRKPVIHKMLGPANATADAPDCGRPAWERQPPRVTFDLKDGQKLSFTVHGRVADLATTVEAPAAGEDSE